MSSVYAPAPRVPSAAGDAEDVERKYFPLGGDGPETLAGAEQVAARVTHLHHQPGPFAASKGPEKSITSSPAPWADSVGHGQGVIGIVVAGHDGLGGLDQVDDGAQIASGLGRVVGRDPGGLPVDDVDAVRGPTKATSVAPLPVKSPRAERWGPGRGARRRANRSRQMALVIDQTGKDVHPAGQDARAARPLPVGPR